MLSWNHQIAVRKLGMSYWDPRAFRHAIAVAVLAGVIVKVISLLCQCFMDCGLRSLLQQSVVRIKTLFRCFCSPCRIVFEEILPGPGPGHDRRRIHDFSGRAFDTDSHPASAIELTPGVIPVAGTSGHCVGSHYPSEGPSAQPLGRQYQAAIRSRLQESQAKLDDLVSEGAGDSKILEFSTDSRLASTTSSHQCPSGADPEEVEEDVTGNFLIRAHLGHQYIADPEEVEGDITVNSLYSLCVNTSGIPIYRRHAIRPILQ